MKQLMEGFGEGAVLMQEGTLRQYPLLVRNGSELILGHPPPYQQPWAIMAKEDQEQFKQMLRAFNTVFHEMPEKIATAAEKQDWPLAQQETNNMMSSCVTCHSACKHKVVG